MENSIAEKIRICGAPDVSTLIGNSQESICGIISIHADFPNWERPELLDPPKLDKLKQIFLTISNSAHHFPELPSDIDLDHPPSKQHLLEAFDFADTVFPRGNLLIHCAAGISRSTAIALAIIAKEEGPGREAETVQKLLLIRPKAGPNLLIVKIADDLLGRKGKLLASVMDEPRIVQVLAKEEYVWRETQKRRRDLTSLSYPVIFPRMDNDH